MQTSRNSRTSIGVTLLGLLAAALVWWMNQHGLTPDRSPQQPTSQSSGSTSSTGSSVDSGDLPVVDPADLPREARDTMELIDHGGPYPFPGRDDVTFSNRERLLPQQPRGYYREYTVITPGSSDRGARRIIAGRGGDWYWTADHYDSFSRIKGH